jgi:predicted NAD/FAD-binding protein
VAAGGYSRYFVEHFLLPVVASVWSAGETVSLAYPARYLFAFLHHHGMLAVTGSPRWRTVVGGSRRYVEAAAKELAAVAVSTPVRALTRTAEAWRSATTPTPPYRADVAVVATHPDQALALLASPPPRSASCWARSATRATSPSSTTTPRCCRAGPAARASWNYLKTPAGSATRRCS